MVQLLLQGLSDKQVGRRLGISDQTARTHRSHLLRKVGASNVCALLYEAISEGWLLLPASTQSSAALSANSRFIPAVPTQASIPPPAARRPDRKERK